MTYSGSGFSAVRACLYRQLLTLYDFCVKVKEEEEKISFYDLHLITLSLLYSVKITLASLLVCSLIFKHAFFMILEVQCYYLHLLRNYRL